MVGEKINSAKKMKEEDLIKIGFEIVRWKEPNYHLGTDKFYKLDYAIMRINKESGNADDLVIRFKENKFILDGFYSVRFYTVSDVEELIKALTKISAGKR